MLEWNYVWKQVMLWTQYRFSFTNDGSPAFDGQSLWLAYMYMYVSACSKHRVEKLDERRRMMCEQPWSIDVSSNSEVNHGRCKYRSTACTKGVHSFQPRLAKPGKGTWWRELSRAGKDNAWASTTTTPIRRCPGASRSFPVTVGACGCVGRAWIRFIPTTLLRTKRTVKIRWMSVQFYCW